MLVEWHDAKAASNVKKHGVTFDEAATVLLDPLAITFADDHASEDRSKERRVYEEAI